MIRFACPTCKTVLEVQDSSAGRKVLCGKCRQKILVPTPPPPAPINKTVLGTFLPQPAQKVPQVPLNVEKLDVLEEVEDMPTPLPGVPSWDEEERNRRILETLEGLLPEEVNQREEKTLTIREENSVPSQSGPVEDRGEVEVDETSPPTTAELAAEKGKTIQALGIIAAVVGIIFLIVSLIKPDQTLVKVIGFLLFLPGLISIILGQIMVGKNQG